MTDKMTTGAGIAYGLGSLATAAAVCVFFYTLGWSPSCHVGASTAERWELCKKNCYSRAEEGQKLCLDRCFEAYGKEDSDEP